MDTSLMTEFLRKSGGAAVIDGGLATELERHGADLNDPLWSAKCLLTSPHLIRGRFMDLLKILWGKKLLQYLESGMKACIMLMVTGATICIMSFYFIYPTDFRLRPDQRHLENGEYEKANAEKQRLEKKQRMSRKLQESGWKPK
ncbi:hypothetical protein CsatB_007027 [Cannabis sativa]